MRTIRTALVCRTIVAFLLITFLANTLPNYAFALTGGPHQIEHAAYEEPGRTDMVNLMTGNFSYSLPLLEVPGPDRSFSLPLAYNAGIKLEQEASWAGLGWTVNPGSVIRSINEYPDDANGEEHLVNVQDMNVIKGWSSNLGIVNVGWDNQQGHYGTVDILGFVQVGWNEGISSVGIIGLSVNRGGYVDFDPKTFGRAVVTVATWGVGSAISGAGQITAAAAMKAAAISIGTEVAANLTAMALSSDVQGMGTQGIWKPTYEIDQKFMHKEYRVYLNHTRSEDMYGVMHLGNSTYAAHAYGNGFPTVNINNNGTTTASQKFAHSGPNKGAASDINFSIDELDDYVDLALPATLATDAFKVQAPGISGAISPYRLDVGSVAAPREMSEDHVRLAPVKYLNYKVPFLYDGAPQNSYFHQVGSATTITSPTPFYGMSYTNPGGVINYGLTDTSLKDNDRIRSDVNTSKKIATGIHVEWMSNEEIRNSVTYASKFIDFLPGGAGITTDRYKFRSHFEMGAPIANNQWMTITNFSPYMQIQQSIWNQLVVGDRIDMGGMVYPAGYPHSSGTWFGLTGLKVLTKYSAGGNYYISFENNAVFTAHGGKDADFTFTYYKTPQLQKAIGGYVVTAPDGTNYHFALPVHDFNYALKLMEVADTLKQSNIYRTLAFANSWLLTAVTSSDYVDRNNNGLADPGDWGGWVKLNYGQHSAQFDYSAPYSGYNAAPDNKVKSRTRGSKELYYLNSIETRSHIALFMKGNRNDGVGRNGVVPLKLEEIALLTQEAYAQLKTMGVANYTNTIKPICLSSDFTGSARELINNNHLKRVIFNYSYELCKGAPNRTNGYGGKLTLESLSVLAPGIYGKKLIPDTKFYYDNNPVYGANLWDGWGYYNQSGGASGLYHRPSSVDADGAAWSLSRIGTPLGGEIAIDYERDTYASVSGRTINDPTLSFNDPNYQVVSLGSSTSFKNIPVNHSNTIVPGDQVIISGTATYKCPESPSYVTQTFNATHVVASVSSSSSITLTSNLLNLGCTTYGSGILFSTFTGSVTKINSQIKGDGIRVKAITMTDQMGMSNKIRYLYNYSSNVSSGVIAKQNPYTAYSPTGVKTEFPFELLSEYPDTPVLYGRVTVLNGNLSTDADYTTKTVYEFETPHESMVTATPEVVVPLTNVSVNSSFGGKIFMSKYTIHNHSAKVGQIKSVTMFDKNDVEKVRSNFVYTNTINNGSTAYQGVYAQSTILSEIFAKPGWWAFMKNNRTTVLRYSYVLKDVVTLKDGITSKVENKKWDLVTAEVLEKHTTTATGVKLKSVIVPAYHKYPELGPKADNASNRHMVGVSAGVYNYTINASGTDELLNASAITWKKDWANYRAYNSSTQSYQDDASAPEAWRMDAAYMWLGTQSRMTADGSQTFAAGDNFDYTTGAANAGWKKISRNVQYDRFSLPVEVENMNGLKRAVKTGHNEQIRLLIAENASYPEVAFSSAEDYDATTGFFGGEVALKGTAGTTTVVTRTGGGTVHTGESAINVGLGATGFVYKTQKLKPLTGYRVNVWTTSLNGRIYCKLDNAPEILSEAPTASEKAGNWYLLTLEFTTDDAFDNVELGVKASTGTAVFDDFRFQPYLSSMTCYTYNPPSLLYAAVTPSNFWSFDNNHLYTRTEIDHVLNTVKIFKESVTYEGERLISESHHSYKGLNP